MEIGCPMGKQQNQVPQIHIVLGKLDLLAAPYVVLALLGLNVNTSQMAHLLMRCVSQKATALEKACRITRMISHNTILF